MYKNYKKYFKCFILSAAIILLALLIAGDLIIRYCKLSKMSSDVFYTNLWLEKKQELISEIPKNKNKIVFLSGSNTLFGINAKQIEDEIGIPVFNFGTHASYTFITFDRILDYLQSGDTVILPLELSAYIETFSNEEINNSVVQVLLSYDKDLYSRLSLKNKVYCIRYLYTEYPHLEKSKNYEKKTSGIYSETCWNKRGDIVCFRANKYKDYPASNLTYKDLIVAKKEDAAINKFIKKLQNNNINVYMMPPVLLKDKYSKESNKILDELLHYYKVPVLLSIPESTYPQDYFYDNFNHLNTFGAKYRSEQIIRALKNIGLSEK